MSITRITEGENRKTISGKVEIHATDGDLNIHAGTSSDLAGTESGIIHKEYEPLNTNDIISTEIKVTLNLFFDGTQNNKTNTEAGAGHQNSNHKDDSYTNDLSNVARGYDATDPNEKNQISVYIEGIGTKDLESETTLMGKAPNNSGIITGDGDRGVEDKVTKGCIEAGKNLKSYASKDIVLKVNVFGFSRGATAARHFLHVATNPAKTSKPFLSDYVDVIPPYGSEGVRYLSTKQNDELVRQNGFFGGCLATNDVLPKSIIFNFVGLYDSVAAYGFDHRGKEVLGVRIIDNDTKQLGLNAVEKAYMTVQFAAQDEHRDNFDLTNINSASVKGLQLTLPGVHSDIGGCYVNKSEEKVNLYRDIGLIGKKKCDEFKQILIEEGWYTPSQLTFDYIKRASRYGEIKGEGTYTLVGKRKLFNSYDKVALNQMFYYSQHFDVKYKKKKLEEGLIKEDFLNNVNTQLLKYISACNSLRNSYVPEFNKSYFAGDYLEKLKEIHYEDYLNTEDLKRLRNEYLHWSASVTKVGLGPRIGEVTNGKKRTRNIQNG